MLFYPVFPPGRPISIHSRPRLVQIPIPGKWRSKQKLLSISWRTNLQFVGLKIPIREKLKGTDFPKIDHNDIILACGESFWATKVGFPTHRRRLSRVSLLKPKRKFFEGTADQIFREFQSSQNCWVEIALGGRVYRLLSGGITFWTHSSPFPLRPISVLETKKHSASV